MAPTASNNYIQRRPPIDYYNRGNYPQYRGLTSGVNMIEGNAIPTGIESMFQSLQETEAIKYQDEVEKQEKFKNLINVSLKDVRGRWRDEANAKKETFLNKATGLASESQGKLTWQQEKELLQEKEGLERFAGQSKEVEDWYAKAVTTARGIKDKEAQKATFDNITKIMATKGLAETYDKTLNPDWIVQKEYRNQDAFEKLDPVWTRTGRPDIPAMTKQVEGNIVSEVPETLAHRDWYMQNVPNATEEGFPEYEATQQALRMGPKKSLIETTTTTGSDDTKTPLILKADKEGTVDFRGITKKGEGIPIQTVTDEKGDTYYGATIESRGWDNGKKVYTVTHYVPNQSVRESLAKKEEFFLRKAKEKNEEEGLGLTAAEVKKMAEETYTDWEVLNISKFIQENKDNFSAKKVKVPAERLENAVELAKREYNIDIEPWGEAPEGSEAEKSKAGKNKWFNKTPFFKGKGMLKEGVFEAESAQSKYGYGG